MKSSIWIFFSVVLLILLLPFHGIAQDAVTTVAQGGFFHKIGDWLKDTGLTVGITLVSMLLAKNGRGLWIKKFAHKGAEITKEIGEAFLGTSDALTTMDNAIRDDGTIVQNSVAEVIASGKPVLAEWNDVIISIKPK